MERLRRVFGFLREKATGTPRDVHEMMTETDELRKRLEIDPWDAAREAVQREKERLEARLEGSKPAKP